MKLELKNCTVRSYRLEDVESLSLNANNRAISKNMRDGFPYPYSEESGRIFIEHSLSLQPETNFAICVDDKAVGGIGFVLHTDIERIGAEIGYWLGETYWGKGIVSEALAAVTQYAIQTHGLYRVFAVPFAHNKGSIRVLEKAGYTLEGRLRKSAIKDGVVQDQLLYAYVI
ncbi:MAG: GNAT family N-acetyltransferase [Leptolinea sp.]|nr:GNAT family N-acetyltransferase [Leptolinea sp.]